MGGLGNRESTVDYCDGLPRSAALLPQRIFTPPTIILFNQGVFGRSLSHPPFGA